VLSENRSRLLADREITEISSSSSENSMLIEGVWVITGPEQRQIAAIHGATVTM
jgi:hypothetical protein